MRTREAMQDPEKLMQNVHTLIYNMVEEAASRIAQMEKGWSPQELVKRVVRYIFNAAKSPELLASGSWQETASKFVEGAMQGYCAACSEKQWFFEMDLSPALTAATFEILKFNGRGKARVNYRELQEFVVMEFEERLDKILLNKAMWTATETTFTDTVVQGKLYKALYNTYQAALDECVMDQRPREDLQRVEQFTKRWMDESMRRAWSAIEGSERMLNEKTVVLLFVNLIAPFGEENPFSCIPMALIEQIGRPPRDWEYIRICAKQLFQTWRQESLMPTSSSAKRRKTKNGSTPGGGGDDDNALPDMETTGHDHAVHAARSRAMRGRGTGGPDLPSGGDEAAEDGQGGDPPGHPGCTSAEDCIGQQGDALVRHMLEGEDGDLYCQSCWDSFLEQNPNLEGVIEDPGDDRG